MYGKTYGNYETLDRLGSGSFGAVYKARHKKDLQTYAIKIIDTGKLAASNIALPIEYIGREVAVLKRLSHPNIVGLREYLVIGEEHILAMEYCAGPTLDRYLSKRKLNESAVRDLFVQLASGLKYMWTKNIIHRDLKPQNILFTSDKEGSQLKIIDFGFSQIRPNPTNLMTSVVGTPIYMAPEILANKPYSGKSDLWSVGCILYEILVGISPFARATSHLDLTNLQTKWSGPSLPESVKVSPACLDLLRKLLQQDPVLRIDWNEFFRHPFVCNPETLEENSFIVYIAPACRTLRQHTHELDPASLVSVLKANLLSNGSADAEKYDGVAAILETKDGEIVEMLDNEQLSKYKQKLSKASVLYLVQSLNSDDAMIEDTVHDMLARVSGKLTFPDTPKITKTRPIQIESDTTKSQSEIESDPESEMTQIITLNKEFMDLADQLRESVRASREMYENSRVYLDCREIQVNALKSSMLNLEKRRDELYDLSISFKKMYKEPMEAAIKNLPVIVETHIDELRETPATSDSENGLPSLRGMSLLDCVGEAEIHKVLNACIGTIKESGRLVDSCDEALKFSHVDSKALDMLQREMDYNKRDWQGMCSRLQVIEKSQDAVEQWVLKVSEHLSTSSSWLGFSFADPIREGLERSIVHTREAHEAARELRRLAQAIVARKELWPVMVSQFRAVAHARAQVFGAFRSLHVCGAQSYEPQQIVVRDLELLPEVVKKIRDQAASAYEACRAYGDQSVIAARDADNKVQSMRNGVLELFRGYHIKYERHPYAKGFVTALDKLAPPPARVTVNPQDAATAQQLAHAHAQLHITQTQSAQHQAQGIQLRKQLDVCEADMRAYREHSRTLSAQLGEAHSREWQLKETVKALQLQLQQQQLHSQYSPQQPQPPQQYYPQHPQQPPYPRYNNNQQR